MTSGLKRKKYQWEDCQHVLKIHLIIVLLYIQLLLLEAIWKFVMFWLNQLHDRKNLSVSTHKVSQAQSTHDSQFWVSHGWYLLGEILNRSHMILTFRFQSSAENNTQDTLTSIASPPIAVIEFSQHQLTFPGNKLLVREQGHSNEVGQEENVLLCLTPVSLSPTALPTQPLLQQQPGAPGFPCPSPTLKTQLLQGLTLLCLPGWGLVWSAERELYGSSAGNRKFWRGRNGVQIPETKEFIGYNLYS